MTGQSGDVLGIHGMKRRWVAATRCDGLQRPSAAWFQVARAVPANELVATLASAVYLGIGKATVATLCDAPGAGRYAAFFATHEDQLPALLTFEDAPAVDEVRHRYAWAGPPRPALTAPYTKRERAGRTVGPITGIGAAQTAVWQLTMRDIAAAERAADGRAGSASQDAMGADMAGTAWWWADERLLKRVEEGDVLAWSAPPPIATKLAYFCGSLAERLMQTVVNDHDWQSR